MTADTRSAASPTVAERPADPLEADIARTREKIGHTVHALAERLDVKTHLQRKGRTMTARARSRARGIHTRSSAAVRTVMSAASDREGNSKPPVPKSVVAASAAVGTAVLAVVWARRR